MGRKFASQLTENSKCSRIEIDKVTKMNLNKDAKHQIIITSLIKNKFKLLKGYFVCMCQYCKTSNSLFIGGP